MDQEDYIKRQIDQLGYLLGRMLNDLLGLKTQGEVSLGVGIVDPILKRELDLDLDELCSIPTELFIRTLTDNKKMRSESLSNLGEILLLLSEENNDRSKKFKEKALLIFEHIDETSNTYSFDRHLKIEKLKNAL